MFRASSAHLQEVNDVNCTCMQPLVFSFSADGRLVHKTATCRPARPRTQHDYRHDTKVKPEAATAVIQLLMMWGRTPETC